MMRHFGSHISIRNFKVLALIFVHNGIIKHQIVLYPMLADIDD